MEKKEFGKLYEELKNNSGEFTEIVEEAKEEQKKLRKIGLIICLCLDLIIIYFIKDIFLAKNFEFLIGPFIFILMSNLLICVFINAIFGKKQRECNKKFKEVIIKRLMSNFYDNIEYFTNKGMPERIYKEAKYGNYYNRYRSDDYLEGKINDKYYIDLAEVLTQREDRHTDSNGRSHTTTTTIFHGLFAKVTMEKSICNELRVARNGLFKVGKNVLEMDSRRI